MSKDKKGRKYNRIPEHTRVLANGRKIKVAEHIRSNPCTKKCGKNGPKPKR